MPQAFARRPANLVVGFASPLMTMTAISPAPVTDMTNCAQRAGPRGICQSPAPSALLSAARWPRQTPGTSARPTRAERLRAASIRLRHRRKDQVQPRSLEAGFGKGLSAPGYVLSASVAGPRSKRRRLVIRPWWPGRVKLARNGALSSAGVRAPMIGRAPPGQHAVVLRHATQRGEWQCRATLTGRWRRSVRPLDRLVGQPASPRFLIDQVADLLSMLRDLGEGNAAVGRHSHPPAWSPRAARPAAGVGDNAAGVGVVGAVGVVGVVTDVVGVVTDVVGDVGGVVIDVVGDVGGVVGDVGDVGGVVGDVGGVVGDTGGDVGGVVTDVAVLPVLPDPPPVVVPDPLVVVPDLPLDRWDAGCGGWWLVVGVGLDSARLAAAPPPARAAINTSAPIISGSRRLAGAVSAGAAAGVGPSAAVVSGTSAAVLAGPASSAGSGVRRPGPGAAVTAAPTPARPAPTAAAPRAMACLGWVSTEVGRPSSAETR